MAKVLVVDDSTVDRMLAGKLLAEDRDLNVLYAMDGTSALAQFDSLAPDIVVTDLEMPNMNGLQLVERIRRDYPLVPVVLMTGQGSEETAVQALLSGAASYVPKGELARHLLETVKGVLNVARSHRQQRRLMECLDRREMTFVLANDASLIPPLVDQLQEVLAGMRLVDDTQRVQTAIALEEALYNALYHGNLELTTEQLEDYRASLLAPDQVNPVEERAAKAPYRDRRVHVRAIFTKEGAQFTIRDEGPGFDTSKSPSPDDAASMNRGSGRGLVLMRTFMDHVTYNATGNEVRLVKRRGPGSNGRRH